MANAPGRLAPLLFLLALAAGTRADATAVTIGAKSIVETDATYASWNADSSCNRGFHVVDFGNANLRAAAKALAPSRLRFGGSGNDYLVYDLDGTHTACRGIPTPPLPLAPGCEYFTPGCLNSTQWDKLYGLAEAAGADFIFGISFDLGAAADAGGDYVWNSTNAEALLAYMATHGQQPWGFELGNEINNKAPTAPGLTADKQADALVRFAKLARAKFPDVKFIGPDLGAKQWQPWFADYLAALRASGNAGLLDAATHHVYNGMSNTTFNTAKQLDHDLGGMDTMRSILDADGSTAALWAGEMGPVGGGNDGACTDKPCGRYASTVWYADNLALRAAHGYTQYQRQDFFGAEYGLVNSPTEAMALGAHDAVILRSDYWVAFLWKRLVGRTVYPTVSSTPETLRAYAFAGTPPSEYAPAACADSRQLILINLDADAAVHVALPSTGDAAAEFHAWTLSPTADGPLAKGVLLNGVPAPTTVDVAAAGAPPAFLKDIPQASAVGRLADGVDVVPLGITFLCY